MRLRGVEDVVAAAVFALATAALIAFAIAVMAPFPHSKTVEAPVAPSKDAPVRRVYVYEQGGQLYAVEYEVENVDAFRQMAGISGPLVAVFEVYPGGYRCQKYVPYPVRIGPDPYNGLWCPPPYEPKDVSGCTPIGVTSRGRWLLVQYRCP